MEATQLIWIVAVTVLTLLNIIWQFDLQTRQRRLRERYDRLFSGAEGADLQLGLESLLSRLNESQGQVERLEETTRRLLTTVEHSVQGLGMVRFRAFPDIGGDQSFALALVDGRGNGAVLTALHSREGVRVYGKPLAAWTSIYSLSDEEQEAIRQARQMVESGADRSG